MSKNPNATSCFHCGDPCKGDLVVFNDKHFCCSGCKTVYQILDENELTTYYDLNPHPGTQSERTSAHKFDYLEDPIITDQLIDFSDDKRTHITFHLPQIHCASCVWLLENLFKIDKRVTYSKVNFLKRKATIHFNNQKASLKEVVELLTHIGYEPSFNLSNTEKKEVKTTSKRMYYQIGISGFAFGNIMFLSLPEYLTGTHPLETNLGDYIGIVSFIVALPVLIFGAYDYLKSAFKSLRYKAINMDVPISLGIISLFLTSSYEVFTLQGNGYFDSFTGLIFFLLLGKLFQDKTFHSLSFDRDYKSYFPISVRLLQNGEQTTIGLDQLKKGDRILVKNKEIIPADAILLHKKASIDYSFVTGEAIPILKNAGDLIYSGGQNIGSENEFQIVKSVSQSYLTQLWNNSSFTDEKHSKLELFTNKISTYFTIIVLLIAASSFSFWYFRNLETAILSFTSVLIIACPCALALSIPFTFGNTTRILARSKFYIKNISVIERLSKVTAIVFDKTGTLTNSSNAHVSFKGTSLSDFELELIKSTCSQSIHPLSQYIAKSLDKNNRYEVKDFVEKEGLGFEATCQNTKVQIGSARFLGVNDHSTAHGNVYVAIGDEIKGYYSIKMSYRSGLKGLLSELNQRFELNVLSGDNDKEKGALKELFSGKTAYHFNQTPQNKLDYIALKQNSQKITLMLGDGLNDAGALKQADVGISITDNLSHFTPASDVILDASQLHHLHSFLKLSKASVYIVYSSFAISFAYNLIGLFFAVQGSLTPIVAAILMPLSSFTVIFFTTFCTWILGKTYLNN